MQKIGKIRQHIEASQNKKIQRTEQAQSTQSTVQQELQLKNIRWYLTQIAENKGEKTSDMLLAKDELLFGKVPASLIEDRKVASRLNHVYTGMSVPIGHIGKRTVRLYGGTSVANLINAQPTVHPEAVDTGVIFITNKRLVFVGKNQTRECKFDKWISNTPDDVHGTMRIATSNRQKTTTFYVGTDLLPLALFELSLAMAHFSGTVQDLTEQLKGAMHEIQAEMQQTKLQVAASGALRPSESVFRPNKNMFHLQFVVLVLIGLATLPTVIGPIIVLLLLIGLTKGYVSTTYRLASNGIVKRGGIFSAKQKLLISYDQIQEISIKSDSLSRRWGMGTIRISGKTAGKRIALLNINSPDDCKAAILARMT